MESDIYMYTDGIWYGCWLHSSVLTREVVVFFNLHVLWLIIENVTSHPKLSPILIMLVLRSLNHKMAFPFICDPRRVDSTTHRVTSDFSIWTAPHRLIEFSLYCMSYQV